MTTAAAPPRVRSERALRRLFTIARCRFAEDRLAEAVSAGIDQVVLHGPCLDTFARHNPYPHVRVFEVRHPDLEHALAAVDFDSRKPSFLIWLDDAPALGTTLRYAGTLASGTQIVFDRTDVATPLCDNGFDVLADVDTATLAARYLDLPHKPERAGPRVVHAIRR
ncbi:class I SAM-dependent methyltransferase [Nocardia sp. NPDC050406]|uniref:class I SAM-dependent methyltransferase n=1 Tax=Nocardia sp. NPDC050406 TaxID=3364318 RepID=UPI0037BD3B1C